MADARDSKSREATHVGSSPTPGTKNQASNWLVFYALRLEPKVTGFQGGLKKTTMKIGDLPSRRQASPTPGTNTTTPP